MTTRRFENLLPQEQADVVGAFLCDSSPVAFSEKLAGQHFTVVVKPGGEIEYSVKSSARAGTKNVFPEVESALEEHHPPVDKNVVYQLEVIKSKGRPDFVAYSLKTSIAVVEFSGAMTQSVAAILNDGQGSVTFYTKESIEKKLEGLVDDPATRDKLVDFKQKALSGRVSKAEVLEVEGLLMDLIDDGKVPSSLGGNRIEGLLGSAGSGGFKIPSRSYSDMQRRQAKFYAITKSGNVRQAVKRFSSAVVDPSADKMVTDVLDYVDHFSSAPPVNGFRVFFSPEEIGELKSLADAYRTGDAASGENLAKKFFARVRDKESWVTVEAVQRWRLLAGI
jgi:hypothetical protein